LSLNQIDKALPDFDQALALNRLNEQARAARGLALLMKGNTAEGLPDIDAVLEKDPANRVALIGRGLAMITSGQLDRAIVALNQVVGKSKDDMVARLLRARVFLARGDTRSAMSDVNSILDVRPGDAQALALRGMTWSAMREYSKALDDLNQAIAKQETVENYLARAKVYEAKNDIDNASADLRRATQFAPKNVFETLAQAQAKQKIQQLSKRVPCGSMGQAQNSGTCL
jgi:tetratricopeptide (TPR) repeat protein